MPIRWVLLIRKGVRVGYWMGIKGFSSLMFIFGRTAVGLLLKVCGGRHISDDILPALLMVGSIDAGCIGFYVQIRLYFIFVFMILLDVCFVIP